MVLQYVGIRHMNNTKCSINFIKNMVIKRGVTHESCQKRWRCGRV